MKKFKMKEETYLFCDDNYSGICLACGEIKEGDCEPDACNYHCDSCHKNMVFGVSEALVMDRLDII